MKEINKIISLLAIVPMLLSAEKHLILAEGNHWFPLMAKNLTQNHETIKKLPFSGFVMVGNSYTNTVMAADTKLTYKKVWNEVKSLQNLYKDKHNFLQVNVHFPADFWDRKAWSQVIENFAIIAKVSKDLNFEGIVFDDEAYDKSGLQMTNFKFPTKAELKKDSPQWEKKGSQKHPGFDEDAYRNPKYTFKEHSAKITALFKEIMQGMVKENPNLTLLVYLGPSLSHENSNKEHIIVTDLGNPREHENLGAIFTGLKQGLSENVTLHDMGESYRYREDKHFQRAYQWRKHDIATDKYNDDLNSSYQWTVPKEDRESWSKNVQVGFMVFNKGQESNYEEYDTRKKSTLNDIKETLNKALKYSDKYVIYYPQDQDWLLPNQEYPLKKGWMEMMHEVYNKK